MRGHCAENRRGTRRDRRRIRFEAHSRRAAGDRLHRARTEGSKSKSCPHSVGGEAA